MLPLMILKLLLNEKYGGDYIFCSIEELIELHFMIAWAPPYEWLSSTLWLIELHFKIAWFHFNIEWVHFKIEWASLYDCLSSTLRSNVSILWLNEFHFMIEKYSLYD